MLNVLMYLRGGYATRASCDQNVAIRRLLAQVVGSDNMTDVGICHCKTHLVAEYVRTWG